MRYTRAFPCLSNLGRVTKNTRTVVGGNKTQDVCNWCKNREYLSGILQTIQLLNIINCSTLQGSKKTVLEGIISFFNQLDKKQKEEQRVPQ